MTATMTTRRPGTTRAAELLRVSGRFAVVAAGLHCAVPPLRVCPRSCGIWVVSVIVHFIFVVASCASWVVLCPLSCTAFAVFEPVVRRGMRRACDFPSIARPHNPVLPVVPPVLHMVLHPPGRARVLTVHPYVQSVARSTGLL